MPPATRIALFDLDGTLLDTNELIVASFQHTFSSLLSLDVPREEIVANFGHPLSTTFKPYARDEAHLDELVAHYRAFNEARHDDLVRRVPGALECVQALHDAGVKLAVVTSKRDYTARMGLRLAGLEPFFSVLVSCDTPGLAAHKPAPDPALLALSLLGEAGAGPSDCVMVGDSAMDVGCGRAAGVRTVAVGWTALERDAVDAAGPATAWVESCAELQEYILTGRGGHAHVPRAGAGKAE